MRISSNDHWKAVIGYIKDQEFKSFYAVTKGPEFAKLINVPDEDGLTILMHLTKNPSLFSVEGLQHLIKLAEEYKIPKADLLNYADPSSGNTPLLACIKSQADLPARLMLMQELLDQGANPLLNVVGNLLNQFSVEDKETIKKSPVLRNAVSECNTKIYKFSYEMRSQGTSPAERLKKYQASLTCGTQLRQVEPTGVTSPTSPAFRAK